MLISWILSILTVLMLLLGVAFFTLLERKLLSYSALRLGPNKVWLGGLIQPLLDGLKLFLKPLFHLGRSGWLFYFLGAWLAFILNLFLWHSMMYCGFYSLSYQLLWLLTIMGLSSYTMLITGWSSSSKFGQMGAWRSLAQVLSFEVALVLILALGFVMSGSFVWYGGVLTLYLPLILAWGVLVLSETQRAPLDLAEAESELVSGYNVEYGSLNFILLFLAEYGNVLFLSIFSYILWGGWVVGWVIIFLFFRSCYPRVRYDWLMGLMWLSFLPILIWVWFGAYWWGLI